MSVKMEWITSLLRNLQKLSEFTIAAIKNPTTVYENKKILYLYKDIEMFVTVT